MNFKTCGRFLLCLSIAIASTFSPGGSLGQDGSGIQSEGEVAGNSTGCSNPEAPSHRSSMDIVGAGCRWTAPVASLGNLCLHISDSGELNAASVSTSAGGQMSMTVITGEGSVLSCLASNLKLGRLGPDAVFIQNGGQFNFAGTCEVHEEAIIENQQGMLLGESLEILPLSQLFRSGLRVVHRLCNQGTLEIGDGTLVLCNRFLDSSEGTAGTGTLVVNELLHPHELQSSLTFAGNLELSDGSLTVLVADFLQSSVQSLEVMGDLEMGGFLRLDVSFPGFLESGRNYPIFNVAGQQRGRFKDLREGAQVFRNGKSGLFITYSAGDGNDISLVSGPAVPLQTVVPANHAELEGGWQELTALSGASLSTVQVVYDPTLLEGTGIVPGTRLTGLSFRVNSTVSSTPVWIVDDYQIRLATSLSLPGMLASDFELNRGSDYTVVRTGPVELTGFEYSTGQAPNLFGLPFQFDVPFTYNGGPLLLEYTHTAGDDGVSADGAVLPGLLPTQLSTGYDTTGPGVVVGMDRAPVIQFQILIPGDVNCDGATDLLDVAGFVEALSSGEYNFRADINNDNQVDLLDVAPFIKALQ